MKIFLLSVLTASLLASPASAAPRLDEFDAENFASVAQPRGKSGKASGDYYYDGRRFRPRGRGPRRARRCFRRCMDNGRRRRRCNRRCFMDEENVIGLFYDTGGFAVMPTDEEFEEYLGESMDGVYEEEE
ncbi:hypothetical protein THAOC_36134 [Thalassiosira oceanica]|uniref:Uncharacterized protein n=1 Tax=Thalassiosira oceanica TaxID=159749 RepID=K0R8X4_THAOC|nr:hypothetical protein THAOC_36134 [Thalassiosira oceanica]|mmetsp:Transcript_26367/g.60283  ORF Transcript_26367/g.60283 Transcript_26367/m.60283 type:complete len:130 (+) Transcript_26367:58-447(+)|eukprot:EJK45256.1 hypothetical protein THAOC_36134 [Thalassiosira oceanica]